MGLRPFVKVLTVDLLIEIKDKSMGRFKHCLIPHLSEEGRISQDLTVFN